MMFEKQIFGVFDRLFLKMYPMLDSCFVSSANSSVASKIHVLTFWLVCPKIPAAISNETTPKVLKHHKLRRFDNSDL